MNDFLKCVFRRIINHIGLALFSGIIIGVAIGRHQQKPASVFAEPHEWSDLADTNIIADIMHREYQMEFVRQRPDGATIIDTVNYRVAFEYLVGFDISLNYINMVSGLADSYPPRMYVFPCNLYVEGPIFQVHNRGTWYLPLSSGIKSEGAK